VPPLLVNVPDVLLLSLSQVLIVLLVIPLVTVSVKLVSLPLLVPLL
jgi:hypothetical protein